MLSQEYLNARLVRIKSPEEWTLEPGRLTFVFPKGGSGKFVCDTTSDRLAAGDVLVANSTSAGKISSSPGGALAFWVFSVSFENLLPLFASNEISLLERVTTAFKGGKLIPASSPLATECHRLLLDIPSEADLSHRGQLLRIVAAVLSAELKQAQRLRSGYVSVEEHMVQVFESLTAVELLNLSVEDLAAKFGCSRRHLNRLFHQYFGFAVATLRMEMRLLKAVSLLRNPDAKIINVAEECGFNHLGLFNTCFKRRFGASPGQWRKTNKQAVQPGAVEASLIKRLQADGLPVKFAARNAADVGEMRSLATANSPSFTNRLRQAAPVSNGTHKTDEAKRHGFGEGVAIRTVK
jgi:AraC-like DNA-binding protein